MKLERVGKWYQRKRAVLTIEDNDSVGLVRLTVGTNCDIKLANDIYVYDGWRGKIWNTK